MKRQLIQLGHLVLNSIKKMENQIVYKVVNIEGKGMGCVALKDIKPGTIILNEVPQYTIQHDVLIGKVIHQKLKFFLNSN